MLIGVVSDTHIPKRAKQLPRALVQGLAGVDLILHAGDWVSLDAVKALEAIAPVEGVAGNNDGGAIRRRFGRRKVLALDGFRIGLVHGDGDRRAAVENARAAFANSTVDIVIFGHSHIPYCGRSDGVLLFNPGSPTDKRKQPRYSYGLITLSTTIEARHIYFSDRS